MEDIIQKLQSDIYTIVGPIETVSWNDNEYPLILITFESCNASKGFYTYRFMIYYMEVVTPDVKPEEIQSRGIDTLTKLIYNSDLEYGTLNFSPFIQKFVDVCSGVQLSVEFTKPIDLCDKNMIKLK